VSFVLPGQDKPVLRQVSFALEPGSVMAVVGPSTAGKSTLCRLLVGSWQPSAGHVRLDGADLGHWRSADRARHVGYLPQAVELFGGTVRQNIARFADVPDEMVVEAARRANCHEMILRLAPRSARAAPSSAAASASGSGLPARCWASRASWCWTSPTPTSTRKARAR
jgi:ABC-type protease/lipase transport system fused ATPase/permease subunit